MIIDHRIVSVSLGSSKRNFRTRQNIAGLNFDISREGTDGSLRNARKRIIELDRASSSVRFIGRRGICTLEKPASALSLGGVDKELGNPKNPHTLMCGLYLAWAARRIPIVDGSGIKNNLEPLLIQELAKLMRLNEKKVLVGSGWDRYAMSDQLIRSGCIVHFGDLCAALHINKIIESLDTLSLIATIAMPFIRWLPHSWIYPTGKEQDRSQNNSSSNFLKGYDIYAGDYHYLNALMPWRLDGKGIITNTVTAENRENLKQRGLKWLLPTTPNFEGRSFGTNVLEAIFVAILKQRGKEATPKNYIQLAQELGFDQPKIEWLN